MKLELKHIDNYCKYGLKGKFFDKIDIVTEIDYQYNLISGLNCGNIHVSDFKPALRSLLGIAKEIEVNGEKLIPLIELYKLSDYSEYIQQIEEDVYEMNTPYRWPYELVEKLLEWHFDIYDLIPNNLAIDINTI